MHLIQSFEMRRWNEKYSYVRLNCNKMHLFSGIIKGICGFCQMQNNQHIRMLPSALFVRGCPVLLSNKKEIELSLMFDGFINSYVSLFVENIQSYI